MIDGRTTSVWFDGIDLPIYKPLTTSRTTDVLVIGCGIAGLTTAYLLAKEGREVIVVADKQLGDGQTGRTSGHLSSVPDELTDELAKRKGDLDAGRFWDAHQFAIDAIEKLCVELSIDADFRRGEVFIVPKPDGSESELDQELKATKRVGIGGVSKVDRLPIPGTAITTAALRYEKQAQFHALKFLVGLTKQLDAMGVPIFCGTRVATTEAGTKGEHEPHVCTTSDGLTITANVVVAATNVPSPLEKWFGIYTKQHGYRTYMVGLELPKRDTPRPAMMIWDTGDPYYYARVAPYRGGEVLIVGGQDHKVGQPPEDPEAPFTLIEGWCRALMPDAGDVVLKWSGQVAEPVDSVGYLGEAEPGVYVITGDTGMGLTHGVLGAYLVTDLIAGRPNPYAELFDPKRKPRGAVSQFVTENLNTGAKYLELLAPGEIKSESELAPGEGGILREGLKLVAVYKNDDGTIERRSAICTHLQCVVHFNDVEKSWDCPCHASRFGTDGEVLIGPAVDDLPKA
jgi:glycine/D-amino acid oxidase-like deaminating enzyme/nitrite reductase/ring-hydroxylating ferredoxin subunit